MRSALLCGVLVSIWLVTTFSFPLIRLAGNSGGAPSTFGSGSILMNSDEWSADPAGMLCPEDDPNGLMLQVRRGEKNLAFAPTGLDCQEAEAVEFAVEVVSSEVPSCIVKPLVFFAGDDGEWFQSLCSPVEPGGTRYRVDVSGESLSFTSVPRMPWNDWTRRLCRKWGFSFSCEDSPSVVVRVSELNVVKRQVEGLRLVSLDVNSTTIEKNSLLELTFELSKLPKNPFDHASADVSGRIAKPAGPDDEAHGFFYVPYRRELLNREERLTVDGPPCWKVRYTPRAEGTYFVNVAGVIDGESFCSEDIRITVLPSKNPGFVRVSETDRRYFEVDDGTFFYPIGHSFRSAVDTRMFKTLGVEWLPDSGTFRYDEVIPKMSAVGENLTEIWMASWFTEIEWNEKWKGYRGLRDYNMAHAWRLDYLIDLFSRHGIRVNIALDNHGKLSRWVDNEWDSSPYNIRNGGVIESPTSFWRDEKAREYYKSRLRYIVARWGYSPNIFSFELISELDLTGDVYEDYKTTGSIEWHDEMSRYIHEMDINDHLVTTHYSSDYRSLNPDICKFEGVDMLVADGYRLTGDVIDVMVRSDNNMVGKYGKPFFVTEFGSSWKGAEMNELHAELHVGLWSAHMTRMAGAPLFWWFDAIDHGDLYYHFSALSAFANGDDRRGIPYEQYRRKLADGHTAVGLESSDRALYYIYLEKMLAPYSRRPELKPKNLQMGFSKLEEGEYIIEYWDTFVGEKKAEEKVKITPGVSTRLAPISGDVALKIRRAEVQP